MGISRIRGFARKVTRAARYELIAWTRRGAVHTDTVLYEAFAGSGMLDNPEAIFDRLRRDPLFSRLRHRWVIADPALRRSLRRQWRRERSVRFVPYRSWGYWRALASSQYLVNNATFPTEFGKRDGQSYLNTWHGTPLKTMGYDMPDGPREAANTLRNFVSADWLLSQSAEMTDTMYLGAYRLGGVFAGRVIEEGYPRTDRQHLDAAGRESARALLAARGLEIGDRPILLYAPTWKGARFSQVADDVADLTEAVRRLQDRVGDAYAVLLKTHQSVFRFARRDPLLARMLVPNDVPTNTVLGVTELLVTDYSSIQFDFLPTTRPIVYYVPDLDAYRDGRGLYHAIGQWPGPVAREPGELADAVIAMSGPAGERWRIARADWARRFAPHDDGDAAGRVVDVVFGGGRTSRQPRALPQDGRPRVLMYLGGMRSNGITSSGVTLANALARDGRSDVSVVYGRSGSRDRRRNAARLDPELRQFVRVGGMNLGRMGHLLRRRGHSAAVGAWRDEWRRCFGDARFDHVVDFSGYSAFWARLLLAAPAADHTIWLHNDMSRDAERTVHGRARLRAELHGVFDLYARFDRLVSVSRELCAINRAALSSAAAATAFTWVPNLVDAAALRREARSSLEVVAIQAEADGREALATAAQRVAAHPEARWFVTVGRLSPEKNHARLVRAFAQIAAEQPDARLLIVGGGPLREDLERLALHSGVGERVVFAGAVPAPAALMAAADCFVLSSDYEGMPMVLLEAAVIGLPIITTRFGSVAGALPGAAPTIVEQDDDAIAAAMLAFLGGRLAPSRFDVAAHNAEALDRFDRVLGISAGAAVAES